VIEETTLDITIENKFHRSLIGSGGQGLRDLLSVAGVPPILNSRSVWFACAYL